MFTIYLNLNITSSYIYLWFPCVPALTLVQLQTAQRARVAQAFRPGTLLNHRAQIKSYYVFCERYNFTPVNPTTRQLCLYIEFLAQRFSSPQSIRNYLSAISTLHKQRGSECHAMDSYQVHLMLRALHNTLRRPVHQRLPLPVTVLFDICRVCTTLGQWGLVLRCAVLFCFFLDFCGSRTLLPDLSHSGILLDILDAGMFIR
jgi:hypothetical protein